MADEKETTGSGISEFQKGLTRAINSTYTYQNNSLFIGMLPAYYQDYAWRYVNVACQWLDGYVRELHGEDLGIISTRIGSALVSGITKQIVGEKLVFKSADKTTDVNTLSIINKWSNDVNLYKSIYSAIGFSIAIGTSLLKINVDITGKPWWEAVRFDQCYYLTNFKNEVQDAKFLIRGYSDTREGKTNQQFFLIEHRYYKKRDKAEIVNKADGTFETKHTLFEKQPYVEYEVHRVRGQMLQNVMPSGLQSTRCKWDELPQFMRDNVKNDYGVIRIDEPSLLPFNDLAVVPLLHSNIDLSVPTGNGFGESLLLKCQSDMITYELAESYRIRDMYLGKGTVYTPKSTSLGDMLNPGSAIDNMADKIEIIKGVDPEKQKIVVNQFELRGEQWQTIKDDCLKSIATKIGMSPKLIASYLANATGNQTATQIDSEDDVSIAFIYHTRAYFKNALNVLLEETLNYMGKPSNIEIDFASPSLVNKDRLIDRIIKELDSGLISIDEAIRTLNPNDDEESIQRKINDAKINRENIQQQQMSEINFDDYVEDDGKENNGTTEN